jgi:hypothetical protein
VSNKQLSLIEIGNNDYEDSLMISGWYSTEGDMRWANEKESTLKLVTKDNYPTHLTFEALSFGKPEKMTVYIDDQLLGSVFIDKELKNYSLPINYFLNMGVHKIKFAYSHGYIPSSIIPGSTDNRTLYVNFKKIALE